MTKIKLRKPTEFAINSYMSLMGVMQLDDLDNPMYTKGFDEANPCHIYMICSRPRIGLNLEGTSVTEQLVTLDFKIWKKEHFEKFILNVKNFFNEKNVQIQSEYPYNKITFKFETEGELSTKTGILLPKLISGNGNHPEFLDLNVLYVGQSYGVEGARTAPQRLKEHTTLQHIYAAASQNNPDQEIWLAIYSFKQVGITKFDGVTTFSKEERKGDRPRAVQFFNQMTQGGITENQFINFTEAALIRYFRPKYNERFKESFPNPVHITYKECYDLDINTVNVEIGSLDAMNVMLYSDVIPRKHHHFATYVLHNKQERIDMFDF